jgi:acetyl-CoA carboxylase carboxyl transferase subunit alpha
MGMFHRELTPAQIVKKAREDRFTAMDLIQGVFTDFFELHGDRYAGDDKSVIGGLAYLDGQPVTVIAIDKGSDIHDKVAKRNGSPEPYGYRKAQRLMQQAAKFGRPVITLINTPGAFPGKTAEAQGQGEAIAQSILKSMQLPVPLLAVIYGEGGSGGALALATADRVGMLQNATYSILSPEGFAAILWKDAKRADEAAEIMGLTPKDLLAQHVIDWIVPEGRQAHKTYAALQEHLLRELVTLQQLDGQALLAQRRARFRAF